MSRAEPQRSSKHLPVTLFRAEWEGRGGSVRSRCLRPVGRGQRSANPPVEMCGTSARKPDFFFRRQMAGPSESSRRSLSGGRGHGPKCATGYPGREATSPGSSIRSTGPSPRTAGCWLLLTILTRWCSGKWQRAGQFALGPDLARASCGRWSSRPIAGVRHTQQRRHGPTVGRDRPESGRTIAGTGAYFRGDKTSVARLG